MRVSAGGSASTRQLYEYDGLGRLTKATDNNVASIATDDANDTFAYNSIGQTMETQDGRTVTRSFDNVGTVVLRPSSTEHAEP